MTETVTPLYVLAAQRMSGGVKHEISGAISPGGTFITVCGRIGSRESYHVGQMHTGRPGWCRRCQR